MNDDAIEKSVEERAAQKRAEMQEMMGPSDSPPELRREYSVQNRLLFSYTNTRQETIDEYEGTSLEERRAMIEADLDEQYYKHGIPYDDCMGIEKKIEALKSEIDLLSDLDLPNEQGAELHTAYRFVWQHARPVSSENEINQVRFTKQYMDKIKDGYMPENHQLKIGEMVYGLDGVDRMSMAVQFREQLRHMEEIQAFTYIEDHLWPDDRTFATVEDGNIVREVLNDGYDDLRKRGMLMTPDGGTDIKPSLHSAEQDATHVNDGLVWNVNNSSFDAAP